MPVGSLQQAQHREHAAEDRESLREHRAPAKRHVSRASRLASSQPLRRHRPAVLGDLADGVRDRVGLLDQEASAGQPPDDRVGVGEGTGHDPSTPVATVWNQRRN